MKVRKPKFRILTNPQVITHTVPVPEVVDEFRDEQRFIRMADLTGTCRDENDRLTIRPGNTLKVGHAVRYSLFLAAVMAALLPAYGLPMLVNAALIAAALRILDAKSTKMLFQEQF